MILRTLTTVDEISTAEGSLVLVDRGFVAEVVRLSPLGMAVREIASDGVALAVLVTELLVRFGAPATRDVESEVSRVVDELVAAGLAEWVPAAAD